MRKRLQHAVLAKRTGSRRAGMSLVEYSIAGALLSVVVGTLLSSTQSMITVRTTENSRLQLQHMGEKALRSIVSDLRVSGFDVELATGKQYPEVFNDGNATGGFALHAHPPVSEGVVAGVPGFGVNKEIVFLLPADDDRNGVPDLSATGDLIWDASDFSYVLVEGPGGVSQLERREEGELDRIVTTHVERLLFERQADDASIPFAAVRVRIWFRMPDSTGLFHPHFVESTVRLRNTNREYLAGQG